MGYIQDRINAKLPKAYSGKLSDAIKTFEGSRTVSTGVYDPTTGQYGIEVTRYQGRGVFGLFKQSEVDGVNILATDYKLSGALKTETVEVVDGKPTTTLATPQIDDVINGLTVKSVGGDPADATWTLGLRRT